MVFAAVMTPGVMAIIARHIYAAAFIYIYLPPFARHNKDWMSFVVVSGYFLSNFPSIIDFSKEGKLVQQVSRVGYL